MKTRNGFLFCVLMAALFTTQALNAAPSTFVDCHGQLKVVGNRIVDANGQEITLRGMSLYAWASQGLQYYNPTAIARLVNEWKCTVLRIPILPGSVSSQESLVKTAVDACIANGIYAIIDWHSMGGANAADCSAFMKQMATAYGNTPNVMYETWNEPVSETWPTIKAYHEQVIAAIRSIDPDKIIFCSDPQWDQNPQQAAADPITDFKNIVYVVHFYAASHGQWLINNVSAALNQGVPVFATEYGTCEASGSGTFDPTETQVWWNFLNANGVGHTNWSVSALGETSAVFNPGTSATAWTDADLKPSGVLVKNYIVQMNSPLFGTCGASSPVPTPTFTSTPTPIVASTWRVNAGGPAYTDTTGNLWSADAQFIGGTAANQGTAINGTVNPTLYDTQRYGGSFSYVFNVPAGNYQVSLLFSETYSGDFAAGDRVFNVLVNGVTVLANLDVYAQAGANTALNEVLNNIASSGGAITLQFVGTASKDNNAMVEAVQIIPQPLTLTATPTNSGTFTPTKTATNTATATLTFTSTATHTAVPPTITNTPVPPTSTFSATPTGTVTPTTTNTPVPISNTFTPTLMPSTATYTMTPTVSPTNTGTPMPSTATNTVVPPTITNTPLPPTATNTLVPPTATFTAVPPSNTYTPTLPTATNTPTTTRTNTAVPPTNTFTVTPTVVTSNTGFVVQLLSAATSDSTNSPHPQIQIVNTGTGPLSLNNVTVKYWFNCDCTNQTLQAWVDWAGLMPSGTGVTGDVHVSIQPTSLGGQTNDILYSFTGNLVLQPGQKIQIQSRFNKSDWSNMLQDNDWSFESNTSYMNDTHITGYLNGSMVWGQEPSGSSAALKAASLIAYPNPSMGNGVNLLVSLSGNGGGASASVKAKDVTGLVEQVDPSAQVALKVYTIEGRLIWSTALPASSFGSSGNHTVYWNEKDLSGANLANGIYIVMVVVKSQNQTSTTFTKVMILR